MRSVGERSVFNVFREEEIRLDRSYRSHRVQNCRNAANDMTKGGVWMYSSSMEMTVDRETQLIQVM